MSTLMRLEAAGLTTLGAIIVTSDEQLRAAGLDDVVIAATRRAVARAQARLGDTST